MSAFSDAFANGAAVTSAAVVVLTGAAAIGGGARARWRATAGSRRALRRSLMHLNVGMPAENLNAMFGPPLVRRDPGPMPNPYEDIGLPPMPPVRQLVFVTKHFCLDALAELELDTVITFCITVTDPKFAFDAGRLSFGVLGGVRVGQTRFGDRRIRFAPDRYAFWLGARDAGYAELHYAGNPGGYQSYVLAFLGTGRGEFAVDEVSSEGGLNVLGGEFDVAEQPILGANSENNDEGDEQPWDHAARGADGTEHLLESDELESDPVTVESSKKIEWFRAKTTINTLQILGPEWRGGFIRPGVHGDITRLIMEPPRTVRERLRRFRWKLSARRSERQTRKPSD